MGVALPRTSVQPPPTSEVKEPRQGLSITTLVIAAIASGTAAIVVSQFWENGTIFASAMTPVVVAILSEILRKPVESERVRSGVRSVSSVAKPSSYSRPQSGRTPSVMAPPTPGVDEGLKRREDGVEAGPVRVYSSGTNKAPTELANGSSPRRRLHLKVAVVTGLLAFVIAALVLTVPELIFGGSVGSSSRNTTVFGGGSDTSKKNDTKDSGTSEGQQEESTRAEPGLDFAERRAGPVRRSERRADGSGRIRARAAAGDDTGADSHPGTDAADAHATDAVGPTRRGGPASPSPARTQRGAQPVGTGGADTAGAPRSPIEGLLTPTRIRFSRPVTCVA